MKTIIITGGNCGLGYEEDDYHIVIACRNKERASEAVGKLEAFRKFHC